MYKKVFLVYNADDGFSLYAKSRTDLVTGTDKRYIYKICGPL